MIGLAVIAFLKSFNTIKCLFENNLFNWNWKLFAESVENMLKNKLNNTVGPMNSIKKYNETHE